MTLRIPTGSPYSPPWPNDNSSPEASDPSAVPDEGAVEEAVSLTESSRDDVVSFDGGTETPNAPFTAADPDAGRLALQQQALFGGGSWLEQLGNWGRNGATPTETSSSGQEVAVYPTAAAALDAGDAASALRHLNGLSMGAMLRELDQLSPNHRAALYPGLQVAPGHYANRALPPVGLGHANGVNGERIGYALCVVETHLLPVANPGDLQATGQAKDAADFLAEQVYLPVAKGANRQAAPHISRLLLEMQAQGVTKPDHIAYVLATAQHESYMGREMDEIGVKQNQYSQAKHPHLGNTNAGDGLTYAGKGYVQLTGKANYAKMGKIFHEDLVHHPDRATEPDLAAKLIVYGMTHGTFTGKKLSGYDQKNGSFDFVGARRIVNGPKELGVDTDRDGIRDTPTDMHVSAIFLDYRRRMAA